MTLEDRLFARRRVDEETGCWIWTGVTVRSRSGKPYGRISVRGKKQLVHRVAYELANGEIIGEVDHTCEETLCFNPAHLRDVSTSENRWNHRRDEDTQQYRAWPVAVDALSDDWDPLSEEIAL